MNGLKISVPGLLRPLALLLALTMSLQGQASMPWCVDENGKEYQHTNADPERSFRDADVVAMIRYVGRGDYPDQKYEIIKSWKSGLQPGTIIIIILPTVFCDGFGIRKQGITIAYLNRTDPNHPNCRSKSKEVFWADWCFKHFHESEEGYAERIRWLDARVKRSSHSSGADNS